MANLGARQRSFSETRTVSNADTAGYPVTDTCADQDNSSESEWCPEPEDAEAEAKAQVLNHCVALRQQTAKAVRASGGDWKQLTWSERLSKISEQGRRRGSTGDKTPQTASRYGRRGSAPASLSDSLSRKDEELSPVKKTDSSLPQSIPGYKKQLSRRNSLLDVPGMSRPRLVDYALAEEDLEAFAGAHTSRYNDASSFKRCLKSAGSPSDLVTVSRYIAKGTLGWIFVAKKKAGDEKVVMKLVRFTQAQTCLKEWYVSKLLRQAKIPNVVLTEDAVRVLVRGEAPAVVEAELKDAGPILYYVCLFQQYMNGGTLQQFVQEDRLSMELMFKVLTDVASTLALMHEADLQHMDIKPENVLLQIEHGEVAAAKLADFGSAQIGDSPEGRADDIRRFGLLMFSLATGEGWTESSLLREDHSELVSRLSCAVSEISDDKIRQLPKALEKMLNVELDMQQVTALMKNLS